MSTIETADYAADVPPLRVSVESLRCALLWLTGLSGAFVFIEPSPYEVMSLFTATIFVISGLTLQRALIPLLALLFFYNLGFWIAVVPVINEDKTLTWVLISGYLSITSVFFAAMLARNTERRLAVLCRGFTLGAIVAAIAGIAGYFHLVPQFSEYDRARGTFNDPNVLGAFLVFPAMLALQKLYSGRFFSFLGGGLMLGLYTAAVFLSFSRGAWGQLAFSAAAMTALLFITSRSPRQQLRIAAFAILAAIALAAVVALLFSIDSIAEMFRQRATFEQSYDTGHFGRFGRHILGFDLALDKPWGIGPFQFRHIFPEDPHNVFLNSFMAGGWLSGLCYFTLIVVTLINGLRYVAVNTPWRPIYIAVYSVLLGIVAESVIIDSDHWRHFFLLLGVQWGLMIATRRYITDAAEDDAEEYDAEDEAEFAPEASAAQASTLIPEASSETLPTPAPEFPPEIESAPSSEVAAATEPEASAEPESEDSTAASSQPTSEASLEAAPEPSPALVPDSSPAVTLDVSPTIVPESAPETSSELPADLAAPSTKPA